MSMYPHQCVECGAAAYIGGDMSVRCTNEDCKYADPDLDVGKLELEWDDEDTLPQFDFGDIKIRWPV